MDRGGHFILMEKSSELKQKFNVFDIIIYAVLILFTLVALYPFIYTLAGSLNHAEDLEYGPVWLIPRKFTFASYIVELADTRLYRAMLNTFLSTVLGVILALFVTSGAAYAFASRNLKAKKPLWVFNLIPMFLNGGMIPYYIVILRIGLFNSFWVYVIPSAYSVFNMIILQSFFKGIENGLYEAAVLDGASEYRIWLQIYVPLSKSALITIALWIIVGKWNSYMPTMIYTNRTEDMWLLQFYLMRLIRDGAVPDWRGADVSAVSADTLSFAAIVITSLPIVILYPFLSRFFTKGISLGSIKG